jgi:L-iditol 2-dehydrogenase
MKQAVMTSPGRIDFQQVDIPEPKSDEVLIEVKRIGVCGSDIHVYHGTHPYTGYPVVQGHEVSGLVAKTGAEVKGFQSGDSVVFMPQVTCGECYPCRHGMEHICDHLKVMGFQTGGAAQQFFPVPARQVLKVPATISLDLAAMIEPLSVAVHALGRFGEVAVKKVIVLGAGTIGNLVAQSARAMGAEKVLITDISAYKLNKALACSLENTVNTALEDLNHAVMREFGPDKADVIFECVGAQATITQAIDNARKGSTIVLIGVFGSQPQVNLGFVQDRELTLTGTLMYQRKDYEQAIRLMDSGRLCLEPMITQRFSFDQYLQAYEAIEASQGEYLKVMIEVD